MIPSRQRLLVATAAILCLAGCKRDAPPASPDVVVDAGVVGAQDEDALLEAAAGDDDFIDAEATVDPPLKGDLDEIQKRGVLRVLVATREESELARSGFPQSEELELVHVLGERLGLKVQVVVAGGWDRLFPALEEGKGDLIASNLTVTKARAARVAFTRPVSVVHEVLIGKRDADRLPRTAKDLNGREVHVRLSSSFAETLTEFQKKVAPGLKIVAAPENLDSEELAYQVGRGERPLTVIDSHLLAAITRYNDNIKELFTLADGRQIAWATRKDAPRLLAAMDAFLVEKSLTGHTEQLFTGDLDGIKKRGVLRVLTRNNPITYFLYRGQQLGFDYQLVALAAKELKVRLEMVVPPSRDQLIPWLQAGRGDLIAASFTVTPEREREVAFSTPYLFVDEVLVGKKGAPKLQRQEDLKGHQVHVRASSSYRATLQALQACCGPFEIAEEAEELETEELIDAVGRGEYPLTVADSHILAVELKYRDDVEGLFPLLPPGVTRGPDGAHPIAFAVRQGSPQLKAFLDGFVKRQYRGLEYNVAKKRYFENKAQIAVSKEERAGLTGDISPYDDLFQKYSARYGLDWRLMAAQAYQESRFDPKARSWAGARGLFQVMTPTGKEMGFTKLEEPEIGIHAGIRYMSRLISQFDPALPFRQRVRFALAAYNAGYGHVEDARRLAAERGLDPDRWFGNVEKTMLLLEKPKFYRRARHGYCRGQEPVKYVSEIQNRYDNYVKILATAPEP